MNNNPSPINGATQVYGLLGRPVAHSLSPAMHNAAFREVGLNCVYVAFPVEDLAQGVAGLRGLGIKGASVTIPFKEEIIPLLDELDAPAAAMAAVNTVVKQDGRLVGYNTDWLGALAALKPHTPIQGENFLVLGAGGAARAIVYALAKRGAGFAVTDVDSRRARMLAREFGGRALTPGELAGWPATGLINATPVGMAPEVDALPLDPALLDRFRVVMDIVYTPLKTRLLREAEARGCKTVDGLQMLIHQGAAQFELWTGKPAPLEVMARAAYGATKDG
uniref:Shikimate dehydrogenase (NADP(+)) n=1 Tax=Desulfobacca acetoxidans TaxID=60893 RepID=A0A7V4LD09_9BACT